MTSSNELMLSNMISAGINTKYQDIPPTEDEFHNEVQSIRTNLASLYPVTDEEFHNLVDKLCSELVIIMDVGAYIYDTSKPHQSWLPAKRADLDFFFWNRYKKYLELEKSWNPRVTATLDKISDEVVDLLGNPNSEDSFQRRGLILGDVQSGKTANYTAICNKAADAGYRIIIVLAGMLENLRQQTQSRLDTEFSGRKSQNFLDPNATSQIKNVPVGVGRFGKAKHIASFTSIEKDFNINTLKSNNLVLKNVTDPILLVVKKNKNILNNLIKWLTSNNEDHTTGKIMLPMLLIDDEADNASVNTKNPDEDPATINKCIRTLLNSFDAASYLGITATPFANIFIDPESEDEMAGEDLFPRDFIYALSPPSSYIGANQIFGASSSAGVLEKIKTDEMDNYFPFSHKKDMDVTGLPPSLFEAMSYFLLLNAIRGLRGDEEQHSSMMVHISRFTIVQNKIAELINEWLVQVKSDVQNYASLSFVESQEISTIYNIYHVWQKYDFAQKSSASWDTIRTKYLHRSVAPIVVKTVNQESGRDSLNYSRHQESGLKVIAVGGNSLSRGLTLEGLGVSYFYRRSLMYDTLLQMGRWFGYRPKYKDLFKIWMSEETVDWYGYITQATNELKDEVQRMQDMNQTPKEFGLKVRQDPNSLIVTARNKMKTATKLTRPVTVSGRLLESPRLYADLNTLQSNELIFKAFINSLSSVGELDETQKSYYWRGVPKHLIASLLRKFKTHPWHLAFQGSALADYIVNKMNDEPWDVALTTTGEGNSYLEGLQYGDKVLHIPATQRRNIIADEKIIRISGTKVRVGSGGCTRVGLSKEQIQTAKDRYKKLYPKKSMPDSAYLIQERKPLLMLYIVNSVLNQSESSNINVPEFLFALGVGFPQTTKSTQTATYMVNLVEFKSLVEFDEDID